MLSQKKQYDYKQVLQELDGLVFARVSNIVIKEEHKLSGEGKDGIYSHFYGFARSFEPTSRQIFFTKNSFL